MSEVAVTLQTAIKPAGQWEMKRYLLNGYLYIRPYKWYSGQWLYRPIHTKRKLHINSYPRRGFFSRLHFSLVGFQTVGGLVDEA